MKRVLPPLIAVIGFAVGWSLPGREDPPAGPTEPPAAAENTRRELRKRALIEHLLDDREQHGHRSSHAPLAELLAMGRGNNYTDEDIARLVTLDPVSAMDELLTNPAASSGHAEQVAAEWARRQPEEAIRYLRGKTNYRAEDCMVQALAAAYLTHPKLVGEVLRSQPRDWQERHLRSLFMESYRVRKPGAPPAPTSDGAFPGLDDGDWTIVRFGTDLLDCLADDKLREEVRSYWEPADEEEVSPASPNNPPATWDPVGYVDDDTQRDALIKDLREKRDETLARVAAEGSPLARRAAMAEIVRYFPKDREQWAEGLEQLEAAIEQLGVLPVSQPSHFEMGPFLCGRVVADWLDDQPLALRRAWAPSMVETWAKIDPEKAMDWAATLTEEAGRDQAFHSGLVVWTHQAPLGAAARVENLPPGELREAAISNAAATWNCVDPAAARKWVEGLPESPGQKRALERLKR